jgi:hypothetical protein
MAFSLAYRVGIGKIPKIDPWEVEDRDIKRGLGEKPRTGEFKSRRPSFSAI